jgi:hypothetical protein
MTIPNSISIGGLSSSVAAAAGDFTDTQPVDVMALPVPADRSPKHMSPETSEEKRKKFQIKILRAETAELPGDHPMPTPESAEATEAQPPTVPAKETSHFLCMNHSMFCFFVSKIDQSDLLKVCCIPGDKHNGVSGRQR